MITFKQFLESQDKIDYKLLKAIVDQEQAEETAKRKAKRKAGTPKAIIPTDARDGGWKIHLRTGTNNKTRNDAYELVLKIIEDNNNNKENAKWYSKKLHGGEPNVKDITSTAVLKKKLLEQQKQLKTTQNFTKNFFQQTETF